MNGAEIFMAEKAGEAEKWRQKNEFSFYFSAPIFLP
jgi:hypothetical protein